MRFPRVRIFRGDGEFRLTLTLGFVTIGFWSTYPSYRPPIHRGSWPISKY